MVRNEFGHPLPRVNQQGQADLAQVQAATGAASQAAIDAAFDAAILDLLRSRGCRNVHDNHFVPFVALGEIWGDPADGKSWANTPLQPIYDYWQGRLPHDQAMVKAKLAAGIWLRNRMDVSPYVIRSYKADDDTARMYFVSPDDQQPVAQPSSAITGQV